MMDVPVQKSGDRSRHSLLSRARKSAVSGLLLTLLLALGLSTAHAKKQEPITDDRLHDQVLMKLAGDIDVRGGAIDVEVHNGVVTLKGKVEKEKQRARAEHLVKKIKGVTSVENQLILSPR